MQSEQYLNPETEPRDFIGAGVIEEEEGEKKGLMHLAIKEYQN